MRSTSCAPAGRRTSTSPDFVKKWVAFGASVRAAQYLVLGGKARALTSGRYHVSFEDVRALAHPVLRHRIITNFHAQSEGMTTDDDRRSAAASGAAAALWDVAQVLSAPPPGATVSTETHAVPGARFMDPKVLARIGNLELVSRAVVRRLHQRPAQGAVLRCVGGLRRASRLRAGRRHPPHGLAGVGAHRPLLHQGVRGRDRT